MAGKRAATFHGLRHAQEVEYDKLKIPWFRCITCGALASQSLTSICRGPREGIHGDE